MRTAYQAKQFEFIQKDMKKRNVQTIEEMRLQNYSLAISRKNTYYEQMDFYEHFKIEKIESSEITLSFIRKILSDGTKRGFIIHTDGLGVLYNFTNPEIKINVLPEKIMTNNVGFFFAKNHFFFDSFNRKLIQLLEGGIGDKIIDDHNVHLASIKKTGGPVIFTLNHLSIGFELWLFLLGASAVVFLVEFILRYFTSKKRQRRKPRKCQGGKSNV